MKCKTWTCSLEITPGPQNLHSTQVFIKLLPIPWVGRFYTEEVRRSAVATFLTTAPINFYSSIFEDMFYLLGLRLPPPLCLECDADFSKDLLAAWSLCLYVEPEETELLVCTFLADFPISVPHSMHLPLLCPSLNLDAHLSSPSPIVYGFFSFPFSCLFIWKAKQEEQSRWFYELVNGALIIFVLFHVNN